jgi:hypothetical protein
MHARIKVAMLALLCLPIGAYAMQSGKNRAALGTSAAVDGSGGLWVAFARAEGGAAKILVQKSGDDGKTWAAPLQVVAGERVAADGENRPKLAFGPKNEMYVSWTSPTSEQFTGDIRFARSLDAGRTWFAPVVVHRDRQLLSHRFESMLVDGRGRIWVAWVDKRDLHAAEKAKREYAGAAIYYAYSDDRGASWKGDFKLADNSCECCRIGLSVDAQGRVAALWRHVFPPNERDHAFALLGEGARISRATFDRWRVDACPHHGPSLAIAADGTRHAVWFDHVKGEGRAFYGRLSDSGPTGIAQLPSGATHADVAVTGDVVAIAWKRFDGSATKIESWISSDRGRHFERSVVLQTQGESDQPRLVSRKNDILLVWQRAEGLAVASVGRAVGRASARQPVTTSLAPFTRETLAKIERRYAGSPFWLMLWDLECTYCMKSLRNLASAQRERPDLKVVTITTDSVDMAPQITQRLQQLGVRSEAYAFAEGPPEALRYAIDPKWMGEKPRAYRYKPDGSREAISGVIVSF